MRIGAALALIAVGAILRFAIAISVTHGVYLQTIGDILMGVGLLGLILWFVVWAPRSQAGRTRYRQTTATEGPYRPPTPPAACPASQPPVRPAARVAARPGRRRSSVRPELRRVRAARAPDARCPL
jgi:protein-S-isoprenylcysteine O-methyltransferase Ste14